MTAEHYRKYFETRLPGAKLGGRNNVKCPFHDDRMASLSVKLTDGVWMCHAGCGSGGVIDFEMKFSKCDKDTAKANIADITGDRQFKLSSRKVVATYQYHDAAGRVLFEKVRYEPKEFSQRVPDGRGGFSYKLEGIQKPLYRLPQVLISNQIAICEGEKDADRLLEAFKAQPNFTATTTFDGAGKWRDEYAPYFAGKQVVIFPDNDQPGIDHAETVAKSVSQFAASVKVVRLPDLPPKGDVSDYLNKRKPDALLEEIRLTPRWIDSKVAKQQTMFVPVSEFVARQRDEIDWLVEGVIQRGANGFICADPKVGKSWAALDVALSLARGCQWLDFKVTRPCKVALVSREDNPALTSWRVKRLNQSKREGSIHVDNLVINTREQTPEFMLDNNEHLAELLSALEQFRPDVAIFDVFNVMHEADENDNTEMRKVVRQLSHVQTKIGCAMAVVHHYNKHGDGSITKRLRGASAIAGWAEWLIGISWADEAAKVRRMEFELKAAESPESFCYRINSNEHGVSQLARCDEPIAQSSTRKRSYEVIGAQA